MIIKNRGSKVLIEAQFRKRIAFGGIENYDPDTAKITIIDKNNIAKITDADLVRKDTGKYSYEIQTLVTWDVGRYGVIVTSTGNLPDITSKPRCFSLK